KKRRSKKSRAKQPASKKQGAVRRQPSRANAWRWVKPSAWALFLLVLAGGLWWIVSARQQGFTALADRGHDNMLAQVTVQRSNGRGHVPSPVDYDYRFPTSGLHTPTWAE